MKGRQAVLEVILRQVEEVVGASGSGLRELRTLARETADAVEAISPGIERHTAAVCPGCQQVCCANRHCYHEYADIVYLCSLGERPPAYREGAVDTDPCQFLGEKGCLLRRSRRPHRCNWFFCTPLLEHVLESSARDYRVLIAALGEINGKRIDFMISQFPAPSS
ncbi:MAG: hypothetical protein M0Z60_06720 [Nitrospiraceae bacterium]|nr:hypothetical protein [Nitrospiraceae bacterium]